MPRGIPLTDVQKGQILAYHHVGKGVREIGRIMSVSFSTISTFLKAPEDHGKKKKTGRPKKLSLRDERRIFSELRKQGSSVPKVRLKSGLTHVTTQTIYNCVRKSNLFLHKKRKHHPHWTEQHRAKRLSWAKDHMSWTSQWTSVIFSDEKRFNLDGPDGYQFYWHCLRDPEQTYSTRQQGGGSLMVWVGIGYAGRTNLVSLQGRQNHRDYIVQLSSELLPFGSEIGGENWIFQQDGAPIHTANNVKIWFQDNNVRVLKWPAYSPDMNPVENLWATLVQRVYEGGRQYENVGALKESLTAIWENICQTEIQKLIESMPNRVFELIAANGGRTSY